MQIVGYINTNGKRRPRKRSLRNLKYYIVFFSVGTKEKHKNSPPT